METNSINSSMNAINLELNQLREIQKITAIKAKELVPDAALSVQFNYENSSISRDAARRRARWPSPMKAGVQIHREV